MPSGEVSSPAQCRANLAWGPAILPATPSLPATFRGSGRDRLHSAGKDRLRVGRRDPAAVALRWPPALDDQQVVDGQRVDRPQDVGGLPERKPRSERTTIRQEAGAATHPVETLGLVVGPDLLQP